MMAGVASARVTIANELHDAVERLQRDIARVEFWADALEGFAAPIPDYQPSDSRLSEFVLPCGRTPPHRREAAKGLKGAP
jgi:hypothetical protein